MLKLKERKTEYVKIDADLIAAEFEKLEGIKNNQLKLGLGNPVRGVAALSERLRLAEVASKFTPVEKPDFPIFSGSYTEASIQGKRGYESVEFLPDKVLLELTAHVESLACTYNGIPYSAPVPFVPMAAQELATRIKEIIPSAKFWLAMIPQWKFDVKIDPILLAEVAGEFFQVAQWGGDAEVLSEYILDKLI